MDEHQDRDALLDHAAGMMYHNTERLQHLLEPPYEVESHRYLTVQCADWICGLVGRFGAYRAESDGFAEFEWAETKLASKVDSIAICKELPLLFSETEIGDMPPLLANDPPGGRGKRETGE